MRWPHAEGMNGESRKLPSVSATGMPTSWNTLVAERAPMVECLTLEDALSLIEDLAAGPLQDLGLLDSALHRPATALWGRDTHTTIDIKPRRDQSPLPTRSRYSSAPSSIGLAASGTYTLRPPSLTDSSTTPSSPTTTGSCPPTTLTHFFPAWRVPT